MRALPPEVGMLTESGHALSKYSTVESSPANKAKGFMTIALSLQKNV